MPADRKAQLLRECDERARAAGDAVTQVTAAYNEARREVQVANSEGLLAADDRTRVRLGAQVVARREDRVESGMESLAGHAGFELFDSDPAAVADEAARRALTMLDARPAPGRPDDRWWSATASAACCSTRPPGTASSPTPCRSTRPCTRAASATSSPRRS